MEHVPNTTIFFGGLMNLDLMTDHTFRLVIDAGSLGSSSLKVGCDTVGWNSKRLTRFTFYSNTWYLVGKTLSIINYPTGSLMFKSLVHASNDFSMHFCFDNITCIAADDSNGLNGLLRLSPTNFFSGSDSSSFESVNPPKPGVVRGMEPVNSHSLFVAITDSQLLIVDGGSLNVLAFESVSGQGISLGILNQAGMKIAISTGSKF